MHTPVKVLLNAVRARQGADGWEHFIPSNKDSGFFKRTWLPYLPPLGARCIALVLIDPTDHSCANEYGVVFEQTFDDRLDYVTLSLAIPSYKWKGLGQFFTLEQGWRPRKGDHRWPSPFFRTT